MPTGIPKNGINKGHFKKGHIPWDKGIKRPPFSEECIRKMRESGKNKKLSEGHKKKIGIANTGKKRPEEVRNKISKTLTGKPQPWNNQEKHWNYKGGITSENQTIRGSIEYRFWRKAIYSRDNFTCQKFGIRGGKLVAHHMNNFADFPELRFAIDNGITLSDKAHREFHKIYGRQNNTKEQMEEFLNKI